MPTRRSRMAQGSRLCAGPPQPHPQPWESILSPILILAKWANVKETGIYSSLFILLNSFSGLAGLGWHNIALPPHFPYWIVIVMAGGMIGSLTSVKVLPVRYFKFSLVLVLLFACFKLLVS